MKDTETKVSTYIPFEEMKVGQTGDVSGSFKEVKLDSQKRIVHISDTVIYFNACPVKKVSITDCNDSKIAGV